MKIVANRQFILVISIAALALAPGCKPPSSSTVQSDTLWQSDNFPVSANLTSGWVKRVDKKPGETFDKPNELLAVFSRKSESLACVLNVTKDSKARQLSNDQLIEINRNRYSSSPELRFREVSHVKFLGRDFGRVLYEDTEPDGLYIHAFYVTRDGDNVITIQYVYPQPSTSGGGPSKGFDSLNLNYSFSGS